MQLLGHLRGGSFVAIRDHHVRAALRGQQRHFAADAAASANNEQRSAG